MANQQPLGKNKPINAPLNAQPKPVSVPSINKGNLGEK